MELYHANKLAAKNSTTAGHPDHGIPESRSDGCEELATRISSPPSRDAPPRGNEHDAATPRRLRAALHPRVTP